jgi:phage/plasmid-like protein (TIGR03299 family)
MAHNLEVRDGQGSFVTAGGRTNKPWHELGIIFDNPRITIQEAIVACRANYDVGKDALIRITAEDLANIKNGLPLNRVFAQKDVIKSHQCTVRRDLDNILGVVGSGYEVVQNLQGFEFVQDILSGASGQFDAPFIETAGVLGGGERMFVTARFNEPFKIKDSDDVIEDYILFTNSHDGSGAVIAQFCTTRVVCNNTLNMALNEGKNRVYFKHTKNVHSKVNLKDQENLNMALSILRGHQIYVQNLKNTLDNFADIKVDDDIIKRIVANVFLEQNQVKQLQLENYNFNRIDISTRSKNTIENVLHTLDNGVGQERWRGSALWVLNGMSTYFQNSRTYNKGDEYKFNSIMDGDVYKKMQKTHDAIYAIAA